MNPAPTGSPPAERTKLAVPTYDADEKGCGRKHPQAACASTPVPPVHMPCIIRSVLPLRVASTMPIVTLPGLLNLPVPCAPHDAAGGTACLARLPRIGWDRNASAGLRAHLGMLWGSTDGCGRKHTMMHNVRKHTIGPSAQERAHAHLSSPSCASTLS